MAELWCDWNGEDRGNRNLEVVEVVEVVGVVGSW